MIESIVDCSALRSPSWRPRGSVAAPPATTPPRWELLAALVAEENIDCDLRRRDAYTVAATPSELPSVLQEHVAARACGLPVEMTDQLDLPYPIVRAVRLADQVTLDPLRYAYGLAAAIDGDGSHVFEHTRGLSVHEGSPVRIDTNHGELTGEQVPSPPGCSSPPVTPNGA